MTRFRYAFALFALLGALAPAAAHAGDAGRIHSELDGVIFSADPGETNRVTVSRQGNQVVIEDAGAPIAPQRDCEAVTANRVRCTQVDTVIVRLGDGDDTAALDGRIEPAADFVYFEGEQGNDDLADATSLIGGPGSDTLRGGADTNGYIATTLLAGGGFAAPSRYLIDADRVICGPPPAGDVAFVEADGLDTLEGPCPEPNLASPRGPAPTVQKRPGRCRRVSTSRGARRIARSKRGVIFTKRHNTYGCLYKLGRISRLHDEGAGINRRPRPVLAGRYVAYASRGSAIGDEFDRVAVWDLRAGRISLKANASTVTDIALKKNGSVAWISNSYVESSDLNEPLYEVRRMSERSDDGDVLVDRATGIGPRSLRLSRTGRTISWTRDGDRQRTGLE
jgi:hypothetical protein